MASAEKLLHDAQYAFQSISFGESPDNKRNAARASSLSKKIIRSFPGSQEAGEAHAILRRLGEEAYSSQMNIVHKHITQAEHHTAPSPKRLSRPSPGPQKQVSYDDTSVLLNWKGLLPMILGLPKAVLAIVVLIGLFLFSIFGTLLFLPLLGLLFLTYPVRQMLQPQQRRDITAFVAKTNSFMEDHRKPKRPVGNSR